MFLTDRHSRQTIVLPGLRLAGCLAILLATGCRMTPSLGLVACPLPTTEQVAEIRRIAPLGTSREETMKRLKDAGIIGNFGQNQSIFYCDIWERDGERWHINVALLFDDSGNLYATRPDIDGQTPERPRDEIGRAKVLDAPGDPFLQ